jgi:hypothetical protein
MTSGMSLVCSICEYDPVRTLRTSASHPHVLRRASAYYTTFQSSFILKAIALDQAPSAADYGHNGRLAFVPARLAVPDLSHRLPMAHTASLDGPRRPSPYAYSSSRPMTERRRKRAGRLRSTHYFRVAAAPATLERATCAKLKSDLERRFLNARTSYSFYAP